MVEISCPPDCAYLLSSRSHPPAAVQRQRERDFQFLIPLFHKMTDRQHELAMRVQSFLRLGRPDAPAMLDDEVAHAARALADTYETASRGIIYEHSAGTLPAQRLNSELRTLIESLRAKELQLTDTEVALVMRAIETAAREARTTLPGEKTAYLELLKRVLDAPSGPTDADVSADAPGPEANDPGPDLIIPGR